MFAKIIARVPVATYKFFRNLFAKTNIEKIAQFIFYIIVQILFFMLFSKKYSGDDLYRQVASTLFESFTCAGCQALLVKFLTGKYYLIEKTVVIFLSSIFLRFLPSHFIAFLSPAKIISIYFFIIYRRRSAYFTH